MTITIRPYMGADWLAINVIHDASRLDELGASVGVAAFLSLADTYEGEGLFDDVVLVAELDGAVAGFIAIADNEVTWMYVHPDQYRRGVGRALLRAVLAGATEPVELTVLDGNDAARSLYEQEGFKLVESRTGPLVGNESFRATGHVMVWTPAPSAR